MNEQDIYLTEEDIYVTFVEVNTTPINITLAQSENIGFEVLDYGIDGASGISGYSGYFGGTMDGGFASAIYQPDQIIDCGGA